MVPEARLEAVESGLTPATPGWFVVNARDAAWLTSGPSAADCIFESDDFVVRGRPDLEPQTFAQLGFTLRVLPPGGSLGLYHAEPGDQEAFLVVAGECILVIEDEERRLRAWDFVHCPPGTRHVFVGAGDGPCVILATGSRTPDARTVYPRSEAAARHGASVATETSSSREAYAGWTWRLARPDNWNELPWAD